MLTIKGYNLMEFSAWGCVPLLAPLLVLLILLGGQTRTTKETELIGLLAANMVCYVHACNAARAWLEAEGDTFLTFYPGVVICPITFVGVILFAVWLVHSVAIGEAY